MVPISHLNTPPKLTISSHHVFSSPPHSLDFFSFFGANLVVKKGQGSG